MNIYNITADLSFLFFLYRLKQEIFSKLEMEVFETTGLKGVDTIDDGYMPAFADLNGDGNLIY